MSHRRDRGRARLVPVTRDDAAVSPHDGETGVWGAAVKELGTAVAGFCVLVVIAAGGSAALLLVAPGSTDRYFSWTLRPHAAAAMIGGLYLAAAVVFAWALTLPWAQVRPLFVGVLGLTLPTLVLTMIHDHVFDFGRWQAVVWVVLFAGAPVSAVATLFARRREVAGGAPVGAWSRAVLLAVSAILLALAVAVWIDSTRDDVSRAAPVQLIGLTGTYLGAWCSFAATLSAWAALRAHWDDARLPLVALGAVAAGLMIAFARVAGDLRHPVATFAAKIALGAVAVIVYAANTPRRHGRC